MAQDIAFAGQIPELYDRHMGPVIFAGMAADMARRVAATKPRRVLETAAGTGIVTRALHEALPAGTDLVATDLQEAMLAVARRKFGADDAVTFRSADILALPFLAESFDALVCQFGLMFMPDLGAAAAEMARVLAPGGHVFTSLWDSHTHNPFGRIAYETVARLHPDDPPPFHRLPFGTPSSWVEAALRGAGLTAVTTETIRRDGPLTDPAGFAHGVIFGSPAADQIRARGGDPRAAEAALAEAYRDAFGPPPTTMPLQALVITARKPE